MQKKLSNIHLIFPLDFLGDSLLDLPKFWMLGGMGMEIQLGHISVMTPN